MQFRNRSFAGRIFCGVAAVLFAASLWTFEDLEPAQQQLSALSRNIEDQISICGKEWIQSCFDDLDAKLKERDSIESELRAKRDIERKSRRTFNLAGIALVLAFLFVDWVMTRRGAWAEKNSDAA